MFKLKISVFPESPPGISFLMFLQLEAVIYNKRRLHTWKYRNDA